MSVLNLHCNKSLLKIHTKKTFDMSRLRQYKMEWNLSSRTKQKNGFVFKSELTTIKIKVGLMKYYKQKSFDCFGI